MPQSDPFILNARSYALTTPPAGRLLRIEGLIGCVAPGNFPELVRFDRDPQRGSEMLAQPGRLPLCTQAGRLVRVQS